MVDFAAMTCGFYIDFDWFGGVFCGRDIASKGISFGGTGS